jgi:methionine synthase I (cobalamin-dependent)
MNKQKDWLMVVDLLLIETIFDTLNAKAAIFAIKNILEIQRRILFQ